jgi:hypothetical protein
MPASGSATHTLPPERETEALQDGRPPMRRAGEGRVSLVRGRVSF